MEIIVLINKETVHQLATNTIKYHVSILQGEPQFFQKMIILFFRILLCLNKFQITSSLILQEKQTQF